jgi:hypothetical protein
MSSIWYDYLHFDEFRHLMSYFFMVWKHVMLSLYDILTSLFAKKNKTMMNISSIK